MYLRVILLTIVYCAEIFTMETASVQQFKQSLAKACQAFDIKKELILCQDLIDALNSPQTLNDSHLFDFSAHNAVANIKNNSGRQQKMDYLLGLALPPLVGLSSLAASYVLEADPCIKAIGYFATFAGCLLAPSCASYNYTASKELTDKTSHKLAIQKLLEEGNPHAISSWLAVLHTSTENIPTILAAQKVLAKKGYRSNIEFKSDKQLSVTIEHAKNPIAITELLLDEQGKIILQQRDESCV